MIWPFKSRAEKVFDEIKVFETRLNHALVPFLKQPEKPIAANGALMAMAINMALHFLAIRGPAVFEKVSFEVVAYAAPAFGSAVALASKGKVRVEDATHIILHEIQESREAYSDALFESPPTRSLQLCLDILLERSGGWGFESEVERASAIVVLTSELQRLIRRYKTIL